MTEDKATVGVVAIGRDEGERLKRCIRSLMRQGNYPVVYVDSGSTDGSVEFAESAGAHVVNLDMSKPFTMARGRNAGFNFLLERFPDLRWIQFVDGDCEVDPDWINLARNTLETSSDVAVVTGRRREFHPQASIYNQLIDMEWDGPTGVVPTCGGDAMHRKEVLKETGGFNETMIAGEEPELCVRIRQAGWKILRLPNEMTRHDAALTRFGQWWKRTLRGGHARAEGMSLHGRSPQRHNVKETLSALAYGIIAPLLLATGVIGGLVLVSQGYPGEWVIGGTAALGVILYASLFARVYSHRRTKGDSPARARLYAFFCSLGKLPEALGVLKFCINRLFGRRSGLIEYKTPSPPSTQTGG